MAKHKQAVRVRHPSANTTARSVREARAEQIREGLRTLGIFVAVVGSAGVCATLVYLIGDFMNH